ncbi:MAG TPA: HAMP domain-containing sensor histidine kinase [Candidatus Saccharimonadales bacterium]|nr:HAMP domain-containing sensor histidine kinase [Candidatus Saccharimonadales bacterium]
MRLDLRAKVTMTISLFLVAVFGLIMYVTLERDVGQLHTNLAKQSKSFAALATPPIGNTFLLYKDSGGIKVIQQVNKFMELDPDVSAIGIVSVSGEQLYTSHQDVRFKVSPKLASSFSARYVKDDSGYIREIVQPFFEDSGAHRYSVVYKISTERIEKSVDSAIRLILYAGTAIMVISIVVASWALNILFVRPLRQVSRSADIISGGDYNQQIVSDNKDEIGQLANAVNRMADSLKSDIIKLQELDKLKTEFMMIASHNLRTPLTIMRGSIESAESARTVEELKNIITNVQDGVIRLHLLAEDLLTISTLEAGAENLKKTPVDAKPFVGSTVSEFELLAKKKGLHWSFVDRLSDDAKLELSQANMRSALGNIIDNAIKFTDKGGLVRVLASTAGGRFVFRVEDTGIGISREEMSKLFTKFHRGTRTDRYDYEGVGIGLYLTKLLVEQHDGHIDVQSEPGKGSTVTIDLPLARAAGPSSGAGPGVHPRGA